MALTAREFWILFHLGVSVVYLHAFVTGLAEVRLGAQRNRLLAGTAIMAVVAWFRVIRSTTWKSITTWRTGTSSVWSGKNTSAGSRLCWPPRSRFSSSAMVPG